MNQGINFNDQKGQQKLNYDNRYIDANLNSVEFANVQQVCDRATRFRFRARRPEVEFA